MVIPPRVGLVANTATPVPVSSLSALDKFADVNRPNEVVFPDDTTAPVKFAFVVTLPAVNNGAVPDKFVAMPEAGVPKFGAIKVGVTKVGEVFITNVVPDPVCDATDVVLPTLVIGPVKFALVKLFPSNF